MEEDKRGLDLGQKDEEERCRGKEKKGWRETLGRKKKSRKTERRQGTKM